ncbi:MAG: hypothetical protein ACRDYC_09290 [Acidimicrobiales bacterium]
MARLSAIDPARHDAYLVLVALHIVAAIVGFGAVAITGAYAPSSGGPSQEEARRYFSAKGWAEFAILTVPVFGVASLAVKPRGGGLLQVWDLSALAIWAFAAAVWWWVLRPAKAHLREAWATGTEGAADRGTRSAPDAGGRPAAAPGSGPARPGIRGASLGSAAARLRWGSAACDVAFVVALVLMVIRPR